LDEPLSALDANLREEMRIELKAIQHRIGVTSIFVTHDQSEALAMSDKIIVMSAGRVEQIASPDQVYNRPVSEFVARFLGASNVFDARLNKRDHEGVHFDIEHLGAMTVPADNCTSLPDGTTMGQVMVRSERVLLDPTCTKGIPAVIKAVDYQGQLARYFLDMGSVEIQSVALIAQSPLQVGMQVGVCIDPSDCIAFAK
jgi:putative spermidine/putrescine transport system ATP-binding protein/spermidine/putrescine transport system ATP-binding protein